MEVVPPKQNVYVLLTFWFKCFGLHFDLNASGTKQNFYIF